MDCRIHRVFYITFLIALLHIRPCRLVNSSIPTYSKELETTVRNELFTGYEPLQRPDERTLVYIGLNLVTINSLDIKEQILSTSGFFTMQWDDSRLDWSANSNYSNIRFLFTTETYAWRPAIFIENRNGEILDLTGSERGTMIKSDSYFQISIICGSQLYMCQIGETVSCSYTQLSRTVSIAFQNVLCSFLVYVNALEVFSDKNWLIRLSSDGSAYWTPGGIFETSCDVDITYYPLDTQTCSIILTTWAYTSNEVYLMFSDDAISTDDYSPNGEWDLIETSTSTDVSAKGKHDTNSYTKMSFTFKLKRRPLFHILNTIFPVLLMASLIIFVFKLPPESGERIGMTLTVLLAYAVYLTLIADNIPQTSLSTSILSVYLTIIFMLSTLSVIFTIVVLDIYFNHDDDEEPPRWVQSLTRVLLVRVAMWKGERCCKRKKVSPRVSSDNRSLSTMKLPLDGVVPLDASANTRYRGKHAEVIEVSQLDAGDDSGEDDDVKQYSWKEVALILDRCFMYLFIFLLLVTTVVCLGILASK